jgi:hypothetical protein
LRQLRWLAVWALVGGGCGDYTGYIRTPEQIGDPGAGDPGGGDPAGGPVMAIANPGAARNLCAGQAGEVAGPRLLRRLTTVELDTTVRAAFGLDRTAWAGPSLPPDPASANGFINNVDRLTVGDDHARDLQEMAHEVAQLVTADATLPRLLPCAAAPSDACAGTFLDTVGARLYRRPLSAAERGRYMSLYTKVRARADFKTWVTWATVAMLQSPNLLYRSEIGVAGGGRFRLSPYEVATALAYTYTGAPPAADLLQLAAGGQLATADQVEAAARALVYDASGSVRPAFKDVVLRFTDQWLGLSPLANLKKDALAFPDFGGPVQTSVGEETRRFVSSVIFDDKGKPADLLTAPYTFVDSTLAQYYGFGQAGAATFARTSRPDGWGVGLLAQGSLLTIAAGNLKTSPTKRGHLVRARLLCMEVPPPPPVVQPLPEPTEGETTRQRYEQLHLSADACKGCHAQMDPIGFGLEHLDASGRFRAKEGAFDIDDRGELRNTSAGDLPFQGPNQLATALARLPEMSDCMAAFMASNAFGMDHHDTTCMVPGASEDLRAGRIGIVDYYVRMARSEHFRTRTP